MFNEADVFLALLLILETWLVSQYISPSNSEYKRIFEEESEKLFKEIEIIIKEKYKTQYPLLVSKKKLFNMIKKNISDKKVKLPKGKVYYGIVKILFLILFIFMGCYISSIIYGIIIITFFVIEILDARNIFMMIKRDQKIKKLIESTLYDVFIEKDYIDF